MSLELQVQQTVDRWLAAGHPDKAGRPVWQRDLDYMASMTYYHATHINGFEGTLDAWHQHLIDHIPDAPYPGLREELTTLRAKPPAPTPPPVEPAADNLDAWLDEL